MMKRLVFAVCLCIPVFLSGQVVLNHPLSERLTGYDIDVTLNPQTHIVSGDMTAFWVNNSTKPVSDAMMHMYLNAFSSNKSSFVSHGDWSPSGDEGWGWVRIKTIHDNNGVDLIKSMQFVSPDDGNKYDRTVLDISLPKPVLPGDTLKLYISFESKLPSPIVRTGFTGDFHFIAQWFPKFGVYETAGMRQREADGWNCHQFHTHSEFYADPSVYNVSVTIPKEFVAGSGGMLIEEIDLGDSLKKVVWRAEDINDFAWTAWPGYKTLTRKWRGVDITLLTTDKGLKIADNQFDAVMHALEYLDEKVGPYPWPHLTFVDPPMSASGAGGMEYTTLFTSSGGGVVPSFIKMAEMVTIHEFGHAYFMGMLASNEFEEPWLDEGVNTYWEHRIVDHYYGDGYGLMRLPSVMIADKDESRMSYIMSPSRSVATNDLPSWLYPHGTYAMMSYSKTAMWLYTLEGLIGTETMDNVFREYYHRWAFHHPSGKDFIAVVNDVVIKEEADKFPEGMDWFFDQVLYGNDICDYRLSGVSNNKIHGYAGIIEGDTITYAEADRSNDTLYLSRVSVERVGDVKLPVEVLIRFDDGRELLETWDGNSRYRDFEYTGTSKVQWATVDPYDKIKIDVNRINNSWSSVHKFRAARRMADKFTLLMQIMISLLTI